MSRVSLAPRRAGETSQHEYDSSYVDLYQPARLDPAVPIEDTVGAIVDCVRDGSARHIGLSEMGAATIRRAHAVHPIMAVQLEYSLMSRSLEREILPTVRELGIGVTARNRAGEGGHTRSARDCVGAVARDGYSSPAAPPDETCHGSSQG